MSKQYQADNRIQANNSQRLLIGIPLMITLVFSFSFVALNPSRNKTAVSASKDDKARTVKPTPLPALPTSVAPAQTLSAEPIDTAANSSSGSSTPSGGSAARTTAQASTTPGAAPQAKPSTSTGSISPQAMSAKQTTIDARYKIKVNLNATKKLLNR